MFWLSKYFKETSFRIRLMTFSGIYILLSALFFWAYPDPLFTGDTGSYVYSALKGVPNGVRPIGYSWFLEWMHAISANVGFVVFMQYLLLGTALLFFYLTVDYLFGLRKSISLSLAVLLAFCPAQLYVANSFMSDTLFIIYTLFWLSSLFWMVRKPGYPGFIVNLLLLFLAVNTRYIGLFYPLITIGVLFYSYRSKAWIPALIVVGTIFGIYKHTTNGMNEYYGIDVFTEFSGWAMANNASIMIPHIDLKSEVFTDKSLQYVNQKLASFPDSLYNPKSVLNTHFIWNNDYPGKKIMFDIGHSNPGLSYTRTWLVTGKFLGKYGRTLILRHPFDFIHYFILLNTTQVFYPMIDLGSYHHDPKTDKAVLDYYGTDSAKFRARHDIFGNVINGITRPLNLLLWIVFFSFVGIGIWKKVWLNMTRLNRDVMILTLIFLIMYLGGSILTHPVQYRYLLPVHPLMLMLCAVILSRMSKLNEGK